MSHVGKDRFTAAASWSRLEKSKSESSLLFFLDFIVIVEGLYASVWCDFDDVWASSVSISSLRTVDFSHYDLLPGTQAPSTTNLEQLWLEIKEIQDQRTTLKATTVLNFGF